MCRSRVLHLKRRNAHDTDEQLRIGQGFRPLGTPMDPAIAAALADLLLDALDPEERAAFATLVRTVGVAGVTYGITALPGCRLLWQTLAEHLVTESLLRAEELRRMGSTVCQFALSEKGGKLQ